jgi:hypothetical protein
MCVPPLRKQLRVIPSHSLRCTKPGCRLCTTNQLNPPPTDLQALSGNKSPPIPEPIRAVNGHARRVRMLCRHVPAAESAVLQDGDTTDFSNSALVWRRATHRFSDGTAAQALRGIALVHRPSMLPPRAKVLRIGPVGKTQSPPQAIHRRHPNFLRGQSHSNSPVSAPIPTSGASHSVRTDRSHRFAQCRPRRRNKCCIISEL